MIAIVGLGLMGGSLAMALRRADPAGQIVGIDVDPATVQRAVDSGSVDAGSDDIAFCAGAEIVFLAVPVTAMRGLLEKLPAAGLVTDLGSTKVEVCRWAEATGSRFVGGHPMCGSEESGFGAARADLFDGAAWVLTVPEARLEELVQSVGAHPLYLGAEEHDHLVAGVSHAAFLLATAYLLATAQSKDWPAMRPLAASGFRDMTRLAGGDPSMYAAIAATNAANIGPWLAAIEASLARIRRHLEAGDPRLGELLEEAFEARRRWLSEGTA